MDLTTLRLVADNFAQALANAASGKPSCLSHIENTIPERPLVAKGGIFQAMAIGGTNFKSAVIKKDDELEILELTQKTQPPVFETKEDFLSFIQDNLADDISVLGLNFAFPLKPVFANGKLEAILLFASKEHKFEGLIGENLSTAIETYIQKELGRQIHVSVANDTICLLLSGLTQRNDSHIAAGIVGTGLNFGYFENDTTLINTEAGDFNNFPIGQPEEILDEESIIKGRYLFEKAIAGAYLYKHFNILARQRKYFITPLKNSLELTEIAAREDGSQICFLAHEVLRRSAQLAACAIAGIATYKQSDLAFVMVGSLFWKGDGYKTIVRETVKQLVPAYKIQFLGIENSDLLGAAKLVA